MKNIMLALALVLGTSAMAQGAGTPAAEPAKKMTKAEAKKACKAENKDLKGKALAECIKSKLG